MATFVEAASIEDGQDPKLAAMEETRQNGSIPCEDGHLAASGTGTAVVGKGYRIIDGPTFGEELRAVTAAAKKRRRSRPHAGKDATSGGIGSNDSANRGDGPYGGDCR
jgi:hypothetical protein